MSKHVGYLLDTPHLEHVTIGRLRLFHKWFMEKAEKYLCIISFNNFQIKLFQFKTTTSIDIHTGKYNTNKSFCSHSLVFKLNLQVSIYLQLGYLAWPSTCFLTSDNTTNSALWAHFNKWSKTFLRQLRTCSFPLHKHLVYFYKFFQWRHDETQLH